MTTLLAIDPLEHILSHPMFGEHLTWFTNQSFMAFVAGGLMLLIFPCAVPQARQLRAVRREKLLRIHFGVSSPRSLSPGAEGTHRQIRPVPLDRLLLHRLLQHPRLHSLRRFLHFITGGHVEHLGGTATGSINTTAMLAIVAFVFIHFHGIDMVAHSLMNGTYGQHAHHQEHDSDGHPPHEATHDLEHMRGEALPADVPGDMQALTHPTDHYHDGEYHGHPVEKAIEAQYDHEHKKLTPAMAILLAIPLYLWNFAPHPFRPQPGESQAKWFMDVPFFLFLLVLELIGALVKPFALCMRLFGNMVAGHVVLAVLISLSSPSPRYGDNWPWACRSDLHMAIQFLELFVAVLQAYIFTFLTTLFLASAVAPEH